MINDMMAVHAANTDDNIKKRRSSGASADLMLSDSLRTEIRLFLELSIPTALVGAGTNIAPLLIASYVGRKFGVVPLSGYTLANLTANLCTYSACSGLFSASDTLGPQAFGVGNYREVGLIAARGFVVALAIIFPINVGLFFWMEHLLISLGQDPEAARYASEWYQVFVCSLPFFLLYNCIYKFLTAQHTMKPLIYVSLFSCGIIFPLSLELMTEEFGYLGSAYAYVTFQALQALLLLGYLYWKQPHVAETWPSGAFSGDFWKDAILNRVAVYEFVHLGMGGIFAQSEWLFWEGLGLLIGLLGVLPLSVHAIPNQVTNAVCFVPFAAGIALAVRMGVALPQSVRRAKKLAVAACVLVVFLDGLLQLVVYYNAGPIIAIFTHDEEATALANAIWWKVCVFNFLIALFAMLCGVATGLGKQWTHGAVNFGFLFLLGLPATYYLAVVKGGGLSMAWTCIIFPYLGIDLVLMALFATTDWHVVQQKIQDKETVLDVLEAAAAVPSDLEAETHHYVSCEHHGLLSTADASAFVDYGARGR